MIEPTLRIGGREAVVDQSLADRMLAALQKSVEVRQWQGCYYHAKRHNQPSEGILRQAKIAEAQLDKLLEEFAPALEPGAQEAINRTAGRML